MGGLALISLSKAHREASSLGPGQAVHVDLELDTTPADIAVPAELGDALAEAELTETFQLLAPSRRREFARQITEAKAQDTRDRRLAKIIAVLGS